MTKKKLDTIKTSGFKTPKDYFSQVELQIFNEVKVIDTAESSGFEVPESYFDTVESSILNSIASENDTKVITLVNWNNVIYTSAIAAALILLFNVFYRPSETLKFEDIETVSIENYLEQEEFTSYELASLLTEDELSNNNFMTSKISEELLDNYLLEHIEIDDFILEQIQ